jgi:hypothetical protein
MAQEKSYKVVSDFNDAGGKNWRAGQTYTGSEAEVQQQLASGHIAEDTSAGGKSGQGQSQRQ